MKNRYRSLKPTSLRFFWYLLCPNWSIIRGTVSLWSMFENRQIALFDGKFRRFRIVKDLWRHPALRMINQFGRKWIQKKRKDVALYVYLFFFKKISWCIWKAGCQKFVYYTRMLCRPNVMHRMLYFERYCMYHKLPHLVLLRLSHTRKSAYNNKR